MIPQFTYSVQVALPWVYIEEARLYGGWPRDLDVPLAPLWATYEHGDHVPELRRVERRRKR